MLLLRKTQKRQQKSPHSREHTQLLKMVQVQLPAHVWQLTIISNFSFREFSLLFCVLQTCGGHTYTYMNIKPERKKGKKTKMAFRQTQRPGKTTWPIKYLFCKCKDTCSISRMDF